MQSIDLIRDNLQKSMDRVLARVGDMREHCVVFPTPKGGGHTLWVLGHLGNRPPVAELRGVDLAGPPTYRLRVICTSRAVNPNAA